MIAGMMIGIRSGIMLIVEASDDNVDDKWKMGHQ
jgi:hypothetical protein